MSVTMQMVKSSWVWYVLVGILILVIITQFNYGNTGIAKFINIDLDKTRVFYIPSLISQPQSTQA